MSNRGRFTATFWGTRGSIACPGPSTLRYGGNTSCIEIRCGNHLLIVDGGTGLRALGKKLLDEGLREINLFLTHTHFDHICGIPFFAPAYAPDIQVQFWAGHLAPGLKVRDAIAGMMLAPLFPIPIDLFAGCNWRDFSCGATLTPVPGVTLSTCRLNHPGGGCGYRIDYAGRSVAIITDTEHKPGVIDQGIVDLCRGCDVMIYDATYTDEEFERYIGWGHSTWQEALRVGDAAGVGQVVLFHHDPNRDDAQMAAIEQAAANRRPGTIAAREGMTLTLA